MGHINIHQTMTFVRFASGYLLDAIAQNPLRGTIHILGLHGDYLGETSYPQGLSHSLAWLITNVCKIKNPAEAGFITI
ncbi:hypothetical protein SODG_000505 [Sodalis praecaptivus]|nr:hypothetical protein NVIRENTERO_01642 [Sodalis praecaptivus]